MRVAEAHIVAHSGCCITPQSLRLLNHALVCQPGVAFDNAYGTSSLVVTPAGGAMAVDVAAGSAFILGADFAGEGMYFVSNDAPVTLEVDPADAADPRCDLVVALVDGTATDCESAWVLTTITGVPAPEPTCPEVPEGAVGLATITVPAGAIEVVAGDITDARSAYELCGLIEPEILVGLPATAGVNTGWQRDSSTRLVRYGRQRWLHLVVLRGPAAPPVVSDQRGDVNGPLGLVTLHPEDQPPPGVGVPMVGRSLTVFNNPFMATAVASSTGQVSLIALSPDIQLTTGAEVALDATWWV